MSILDDVTTQASQWCVQARRLCEASENSKHPSLPELFDAIGVGVNLRRQLDGLDRTSASPGAARSRERALGRSSSGLHGELAGLAPATPRY